MRSPGGSVDPEDLARILTLGRVFQRNDLRIDDIGDWQPTMPDCLHELSVVSKGRRLAGVERMRFRPAETEPQ
jgi:hypothetical protein